MDEQELWMPADDETIRGALDTLRWETEALPLAEVRFVKARGKARRRRAQLVGSVSAAAAVAAVGFIGLQSIGSNRAADVGPAAPTSTSAPTSAPSANPTVTIAAPGPLLVVAEWQRALGITGTIQLGDMRPGEGVFADCPVRTPGTQLASRSVYVQLTGPDADQAVYRATSPDAGIAAADAVVSQLVGCQQPGMQFKLKAEANVAWPKVFSTVTVTPDGKRVDGWYVVAHQGALTSLIGVFQVITPSPPSSGAQISVAQIQALALVAQQRLVQEVEGATSPSASSTP